MDNAEEQQNADPAERTTSSDADHLIDEEEKHAGQRWKRNMRVVWVVKDFRR